MSGYSEHLHGSELIVEFDRSFYGCPFCGSEYYDDYYDSGEDEEEEESEDDEEYE